jgi:hypothetical protein
MTTIRNNKASYGKNVDNLEAFCTIGWNLK